MGKDISGACKGKKFLGLNLSGITLHMLDVFILHVRDQILVHMVNLYG
jgi:hypothetical protein